jgi:membrane-bound lytic murein transglycosylase D
MHHAERVPGRRVHHDSVGFAPVLLILGIVLGTACATHRAPIETVPAAAVEPGALPDSGTASGGPGAGIDAVATQPLDEPVEVLPEGGVETAVDAGVAEDAAEDDLDYDSMPAPHDELAETPPAPSAAETERERRLVEGQTPAFDIPMEVNEKVTAWVDYFTGPHREKFAASLVRSGRYLPLARAAFAEAGIPQDLAYMAHVESAFKPRAYSRAKAKGIFQFIGSTGRRYDLRADNWVDERSNPEASARAAAAYLKDLHGMFGDWYLALAAYNAGEGKVGRGLSSSRTADFWSLAKTRYIRPETKNYVPAILAATLIAKDPARFGFDIVPDPPLAYDIVEVRGSYDLGVIARQSGTPVEVLKDLNPDLRRWRTPPGRTFALRVPPGAAPALSAALTGLPEAARTDSVEHVVRKGDTLGRIAGRYRVSVASIQAANRMGKSTVIHPGRTLVIPTSGDFVVADFDPEPQPSKRSAGSTYRVRAGDTLSSIARRHGTTIEAIASASGISVQRTLKVGDLLRLPGAAHEARGGSAASLRHRIRRGDTLTEIASLYRTSVDRLCQLNQITRDDVLVPGRTLTVRVN